MNTTILNYKKTKHFMFRQWDRTISDNLLYRVLPLLKETKPNTSVLYWIDLKQLKEPPPYKHNILGLVIKNNLLISCFWFTIQENQKQSCNKRKYPSKRATRI